MEFEDMAAGGGEAFVKRVEGELVEGRCQKDRLLMYSQNCSSCR